MNIIHQHNDTHIIRFDADEDIISGIIDFCVKNTVTAGYFTAIGACKKLVLSYYNLATKEYEDREINEDLEITGVTGNIAVCAKEIVIHAHGTFGDQNLGVRAGHIKKLIVSATGEVVLHAFPGTITREYDEVTKLNLMKSGN